MGSPGRRALLAMLLLSVAPVPAADLTFSGRVAEVTSRSIALRLDDGLVVDALLPRKAQGGAPISAGDVVRMDCKKIKAVWAPEASRYRFLEVTGIELLRHAAPDRSARIAQQEPTDDAALARAREVNLRYASQLPNYVADETATRYTRESDSQNWRYLDTIQTEITIRGGTATRQQIRSNGKPTRSAFERLGGFKWYGGFGTEIRPIFDLHCPTVIEQEGDPVAADQHLLEYRFESPAHACFVPFYFEYERYNPARTGHVFVDEQGRVVKLIEEAKDFPPGFEFQARTEEVSWQDVKIAGSSHLLPVKATFVVLYSSGAGSRVEVEFKNHRHFEASTTIIPLR